MDPQSAGDPSRRTTGSPRTSRRRGSTRGRRSSRSSTGAPRRAGSTSSAAATGGTELLAERADAVVGVDLSRELLREAVARARERGYDGTASFVHGDAATLPIATDAVGVAVYVATLHHLPSREARVRSSTNSRESSRPAGLRW